MDGGKVHGTIPALDPDALEDGRDVLVPTDFRSVFAEVAGSHLDIDQDEILFPNWDGKRIELMKA